MQQVQENLDTETKIWRSEINNQKSRPLLELAEKKTHSLNRKSSKSSTGTIRFKLSSFFLFDIP